MDRFVARYAEVPNSPCDNLMHPVSRVLLLILLLVAMSVTGIGFSLMVYRMTDTPENRVLRNKYQRIVMLAFRATQTPTRGRRLHRRRSGLRSYSGSAERRARAT
jgi:hypothetical protein